MKKKLAQICLGVAVVVSVISAFYFAISRQQYAISGCFAIVAILLVLGGRIGQKNK